MIPMRLHFFNPVHKMHLIEVIRGQACDDDTIVTLVELVPHASKSSGECLAVVPIDRAEEVKM
jgi:3-hydroxyacyl-CoA dehydrogenase